MQEAVFTTEPCPPPLNQLFYVLWMNLFVVMKDPGWRIKFILRCMVRHTDGNKGAFITLDVTGFFFIKNKKKKNKTTGATPPSLVGRPMQ